MDIFDQKNASLYVGLSYGNITILDDEKEPAAI
jgi:hypothetical protein